MGMGYVIDIEEATEQNTFFRKVLLTVPKSQLVVMSLNPGEEIGMEVHDLDQFIRIEEGSGFQLLAGSLLVSAPYVSQDYIFETKRDTNTTTAKAIKTIRARLKK